MDTNSLDSNMVTLMAMMVTLMAMIAGSWITVVVLMIRQSNRHEDSIRALDDKLTNKIDGRFDALDTKFTGMIGNLDTKFTGMIGNLDTKLTNRVDSKIDALDAKFTTKIDALADGVTDVRERLARVEGHLMAPEGFRPRLRRGPSDDDPPSEDPGSSRREAG